jgi:transcription termination/antitermination protein NusA
MDIKGFTSAISQIATEKEIPQEKVVEIIEQAIATAYKKEYREKGEVIKAKIEAKTGDAKFWLVKTVVDESTAIFVDDSEEETEEDIETEEGKVRYNPKRHITIEEAKKIKKDVKVGEEIETELETKQEFGRIAAQTAKQVILQKIKETERDLIFREYKEKEGEVISGIVQRVEGRNILLDIGKILGIMHKEEQIPGEIYRPGQRYKAFVLSVEDTPKGPNVVLSRAFPKFVSKMFELEVPEITAGTVEIKALAREAGSRTKVAVYSQEEGVDPVGTAVGQRGTRVGAIISELNGEKIDIVEYLEKSEDFIRNALSPAKISEVQIKGERAIVIVPEDQLSLAIGREGQNVRLAAKLTGWRIDVKAIGKEEVEETAGADDIDKKESEVTEEEKQKEEEN